MKTKQIYFKSDFKVFLESKAGWGVPFRLKFYTNVPSRPYIACFDGTTYTNCHLENETTLCVSFNDHKLGLGTLWCAPTFYLDDACFSDNVCDEYVQPFKVEFKGAPDVEVIDDFFLIEIPNKGIYDGALETVGKIKYGNVSIDNVKIKKGQTARIEFDEESQHVGEFGFCVDNTRGGYYQYADYVKVSEKEFVAYDDMIIYAYSFFITPKTNAKVIVETPGENCNIVLSLTGSSTLETLGTLPAYYQKGDKGEAGPVGPQGPQGEKGDKGDPGSFEDAPADGKQYARQNNAWAVVAGGGVADAYTKAESDERYQAKGNYQPAGNYATTAQLANYQPTITDLDQIRANAALGATAVQTETDPTVPSWAKQPNKPTYTAAEVGAASQEELTQLGLELSEIKESMGGGTPSLVLYDTEYALYDYSDTFTKEKVKSMKDVEPFFCTLHRDGLPATFSTCIIHDRTFLDIFANIAIEAGIGEVNIFAAAMIDMGTYFVAFCEEGVALLGM